MIRAECACGLVACAECRERWLGPACRVCGASERAHSLMSGLHKFAMSCRVIYDRAESRAAFYCSTSGVAFGPVFGPVAHLDAEEVAHLYLDQHIDPRILSDDELSASVSRWLAKLRAGEVPATLSAERSQDRISAR